MCLPVCVTSEEPLNTLEVIVYTGIKCIGHRHFHFLMNTGVGAEVEVLGKEIHMKAGYVVHLLGLCVGATTLMLH